MSVKSIVVKLIIILLPLTLFSIFVEVRTFMKQDMYQKKAELLDFYKDEVEVLYMGSSMMLTAVMPQLSAVPALNLGLPVENVYTSLRLASHLQPDLPRLHTLVISVYDDSFLLQDTHKTHAERDYWIRFGLEPKNPVEEMLAVFSNSTRRTLEMIPFIPWNFENHPATEGITTHPTERGHAYWMNQEPIEFPRLAQLMCATEYIPTQPEIHENNLTWIKNWLDVNLAPDTRVVFVALPAEKHCMDSRPDAWRSLLRLKMTELTESCSTCTFLDYTQSPEWHQSEYFADAVHMNLHGATTFTKALLNDLGLPQVPDEQLTKYP
jgi:hypothetical protein